MVQWYSFFAAFKALCIINANVAFNAFTGTVTIGQVKSPMEPQHFLLSDAWWSKDTLSFLLVAISLRPALGTMRLIARKMLYVRCVSQCLHSLQIDVNLAGKD